ncbi:MAG TPA: hypothetical protein ENN21_10880 [Spirochaetes bacterium]|nr:hypothetical protein [Spirochaetota bacterium]
MRVEAETISVSGKARKLEVFSRAGAGDRFRAKIVERPGGNRAVLDVNGSRISAEFLKGVPAGRYITLVLSRATGNALYFKIQESPGPGAGGLLGRFTLLDAAGLKLPAMGTGLFGQTGAPSGIFELNQLLLRQCGYDFGGRSSLAAVLNRLRPAGIKLENLEVFSYLFWNIRGINLDYLMTLVNTFGQKERNSAGKRKETPVKTAVKELIEGLTEDIEKLSAAGRDEAEWALNELLIMAGAANSEAREGVVYGSFPWFDGEDFRDAELIAAEDSLLVRVVYSALGRITVLARELSREADVGIFCENSVSLNCLREDTEGLRATLSSGMAMNVKLNVYLEGLILDKIIESDKELCSKGGFSQWA